MYLRSQNSWQRYGGYPRTEVNTDVLKQQMKAHAEKAKQPMPELNDEMMSRLLEHASCDIFPIQVRSLRGWIRSTSRSTPRRTP